MMMLSSSYKELLEIATTYCKFTMMSSIILMIMRKVLRKHYLISIINLLNHNSFVRLGIHVYATYRTIINDTIIHSVLPIDDSHFQVLKRYKKLDF
jgi:hypothetical protein